MNSGSALFVIILLVVKALQFLVNRQGIYRAHPPRWHPVRVGMSEGRWSCLAPSLRQRGVGGGGHW